MKSYSVHYTASTRPVAPLPGNAVKHFHVEKTDHQSVAEAAKVSEAAPKRPNPGRTSQFVAEAAKASVAAIVRSADVERVRIADRPSRQ